MTTEQIDALSPRRAYGVVPNVSRPHEVRAVFSPRTPVESLPVEPRPNTDHLALMAAHQRRIAAGWVPYGMAYDPSGLDADVRVADLLAQAAQWRAAGRDTLFGVVPGDTPSAPLRLQTYVRGIAGQPPASDAQLARFWREVGRPLRDEVQGMRCAGDDDCDALAAESAHAWTEGC